MSQLAAVGVAGLLGGMAGVQVALVLGARWGRHVYGGRAAGDDGTLPAPYRAMSAVAVVVLAAAAWVVLARADLVPAGPFGPTALRWGSWVIAGWLGLNTVANLTSTSPIERWGFGALTAVACALVVVVARS